MTWEWLKREKAGADLARPQRSKEELNLQLTLFPAAYRFPLCTRGGGCVQTWKKFLALLAARSEHSFSSDTFGIFFSQSESEM